MEDLQERLDAVRPIPGTRTRSRGNRIWKRRFGDGAIVTRLMGFGQLSRCQGSDGGRGLGQRLEAGESHSSMLRRYLWGSERCLGLRGNGVKARKPYEFLV